MRPMNTFKRCHEKKTQSKDSFNALEHNEITERVKQ